MPKILKTLSGVYGLTGDSAPTWFHKLDLSPDRIPQYADYYFLGENCIVYAIKNIGSEVDADWRAYRWLPNKSIEHKTNIFHMCSKGVMAGDISPSFPTKRELQKAIEDDTITFSEWKETPSFVTSWEDRCEYIRNKENKKKLEHKEPNQQTRREDIPNPSAQQRKLSYGNSAIMSTTERNSIDARKKSKPLVQASRLLLVLVILIGAIGSCLGNKGEQDPETKTKKEDKSWVPEGFTEATGLVAFRWSPEGTFDCDTNLSCQQIELVPRYGCSFLYVQASLIDTLDKNVGFTNASTGGVKAGQTALLMLETYNEKFNRFRISEIKCY